MYCCGARTGRRDGILATIGEDIEPGRVLIIDEIGANEDSSGEKYSGTGLARPWIRE